ncbi:PAS domain S-box protein [Rubrobacter tropicus]|nr:PAS domain S-box protein [Rubrobacter tropicus]
MGAGVPVRLLLVEDSENDAMLLLRELRRGGYEPDYERVYTPEDMERALKDADARGGPFEVVVSDYYMPRFRAPDALELLRGLGYDVPFIVVSGKIGEDAAVGIMKAGANDYLTKENMARLCPAIARELKEAGVRRERARAEEALARSEERFRRLVEQAADAMFVHDLEGNLVDVNRRACESLGYSREELLGMNVADVEVGIPPETFRGVWDRISSGAPVTLEGKHRRKDGTTFPVEVRVGAFESGEQTLHLALARDVTGRRDAERKVREAEARYRTLVEQIPAVTYVQQLTGDKRVTYVSPQVESVLGYPADRELLDGDHWTKIMHPDDRERVLAEDERTDKTGEPFRAEYRQFASDGRMVWIRDEAVLVRDEDGNPLYWQGVQYDITDQKLAEEGLRRSEERYRTFIAQSTEGIWCFEFEEPLPTDLSDDEQLDHLYRHAYLAECNDAMARMYGFGGASEIVGARVGDLLPRSKPENVEFLRAATRAGYRITEGETTELDRDGSARVIVNNLTGIVEDGYVVRVWGTQRDVTEQKEAEEQLARLASFPELNPNPIIETSVAGEPTYLNPVAQARFPDLRRLGPDHPALADLEGVNQRIWSAGGRPFTREIEVGGRYYQQTVSRTPEGGLLRIYGIDVTERRQAEDALRKSEERFRSLVQNTSDIIIVLDEDGTVVYESPAIERVLGYKPEERIGSNAFELIHPDDRDRVAGVFSAYQDHPGPFPPVEYRVMDKSGEWRTLEAVGENLLDDPVIQGIVVNSRDVTERRRTEEALKQSEELLRTVVTNAPVALFSLDVEGVFTFSAGRGLKTLGLEPGELAGRSAYEVYAGAPGVLEDIRRALAGEEFVGTSEVGGLVFETWYGPLRAEDGAVKGVIGVATDVTERAEAEDGLRRTLKELADLKFALDESAIVAITDQKGAITYVNDKFCEISGYSQDELVGQDHRLVNSGHHPPEYIKGLWRTIARGRVWRGELKNRAKDGSIYWVDTTIVPFLNERGKPYQYAAIRYDVTARKAAEEALRESQESLQAILDNTTAVIYVKDAEGRYVLVNRRFEDLFHFAKDQVIGKTDHDIFGKESADAYRKNDLEVLRSEAPLEVEETVFQDDGTHTYVSVKFPLKGPDGSPYATCGISTDITPRKRTERELRESEERFRATFDQAAVGMAQVGLDGRWLRVNRRLCEILGHTEEELLDLDFQRITHPDDLDKDLESLGRLISGEIETFWMEKRYFHKRGSTVWVNQTVSLVRGPSEASEYLIAVVEDITERRRAEEALRESEERYRTLFTTIDEGFCLCEMVVDEDGTPADYRFLDVNPKFEEMTGLADAVGKTITELVPGLEGRWVETYGRVGLGGETLRFEDGSEAMGRWFDVYASPVEPKGGGRFTLVFKDITERKRAEEALRLSEARANLALGVARLGTWSWDPGRDEIFADARTREICGLDPDTPLSLSGITPLVHPEDRPRVEAAMGAALQPDGDGLYAEEFRFVRPDGDLRWVISRGQTLFEGEQRRPDLLLGTVLDITERKRAEESLRQSEELYRSVIEQAVESIFLLDIESLRVLEANAALGETLGYTPEELKGMSFYDISAHDRESVGRNVERVVREGRLSLGVRQYRRKDGGLVDVEISISTVPYGGRRAMCVVAHDVTGRRRAEKALEGIREAERNRIARELHDSILQDIVYALQEIQVLQVTGQNGDDPALQDSADALRRSVEGLRGAIFELRLKETTERSFVSSLKSLVDLSRRMARGKYELDLVVGSGVPQRLPEGYGREVVRIVQEALTNVRRHAAASRVRVEIGVDGDNLYAEVVDDGRGFDPEDSHSGVGQYSMRQRALDLGGELKVESGVGGGTRVLLRVPLSRLAEEISAKEQDF